MPDLTARSPTDFFFVMDTPTTLYTCEDCGALVSKDSRGRHRKWHEEQQRELARLADGSWEPDD